MLEKLLAAIEARFPLTGNEDATRQFQAMGMAFEARLCRAGTGPRGRYDRPGSHADGDAGDQSL